ncbi:MAG: prephenate dehydrogenase [Flavobacteriaceae bacterium]|nr:prephenate dehydrogenase [Flavobacteriaceae bacterium]MDG2234773.1 prephenate dehydrogenase [Flavobacteriaceae bacterium]|tara:strand:+ start:2117 stop:2965 length:849 start_codon:yes stop_codon:yes gene_type:complete
MNIGIIGLGLIGGSFALSARKLIEDSVLYGEDKNDLHQKQALELKIVDQSLKPSNYYYMDVIILAIPVNAALDRVIPLLDQINDNTLLIDVGSTKSMICKKLELHPKRNQFLATHPIAGTEFSGPSAAYETLYDGKAQILCESNKTRSDLLEWAVQWFKNMGMELQEMDPKEHDQHIAYVSHLSHISSFMLGKTVMEKEQDEKAIFDMAGSGFASTVRLAKSSPSMWTPIFEQNQENILEVLEEYITNLKEFKSLMEQKDYKTVFKKIQETNAIREILAGIN